MRYRVGFIVMGGDGFRAVCSQVNGTEVFDGHDFLVAEDQVFDFSPYRCLNLPLVWPL